MGQNFPSKIQKLSAPQWTDIWPISIKGAKINLLLEQLHKREKFHNGGCKNRKTLNLCKPLSKTCSPVMETLFNSAYKLFAYQNISAFFRINKKKER